MAPGPRATPGEPTPPGAQPWGVRPTQITGRLKEAVGVITENDRLKRAGQTDQVVGEVKATAARAAEKVKDAEEALVL